MKFCIYYDSNGEAVSYCRLLHGDPAFPIGGLFHIVSEVEPVFPGYVQNDAYVPRPSQPSRDHTWDIQAKTWVFNEAAKAQRLASLTFDALDQIDQTAGKARLKYITSVPGQAETYQRKEQQAREWKAAGFTGTPPVFVAAEAQALGQDPVDVANYIIETADQWGNFKGPQIEATRRKWKVAIEQAGSDEAAIVAARDAGIAELMTL